jgi:hypothetical protein
MNEVTRYLSNSSYSNKVYLPIAVGTYCTTTHITSVAYDVCLGYIFLNKNNIGV